MKYEIYNILYRFGLLSGNLAPDERFGLVDDELQSTNIILFNWGGLKNWMVLFWLGLTSLKKLSCSLLLLLAERIENTHYGLLDVIDCMSINISENPMWTKNLTEHFLHLIDSPPHERKSVFSNQEQKLRNNNICLKMNSSFPASQKRKTEKKTNKPKESEFPKTKPNHKAHLGYAAHVRGEPIRSSVRPTNANKLFRCCCLFFAIKDVVCICDD